MTNRPLLQNWCCFTWFSWACLVAAAAEPEIRIVHDGVQRPVAVDTIAADGGSLDAAASLSVYVLDESGRRSDQALAGRIEKLGAGLRFTPQFAFRPGMSYEAIYSPSAASPATSHRFSIPAPPPPSEPTRVLAVYPSSDVLPDNHLRFYLHFSAPMNFGEAYSHVKLFASDQREIKRAFLEIGEELWDGTGTRLTLLFDPGRVKKGLLPREEFGPVLLDGKRYRLVIDSQWRDANGKPLVASYEKAFRAGPPVESAVDYKKWQLAPPPAGTRGVLTVRFDRPLDRALLHRMIGVAPAAGQALKGEILLADDEQRWEFRPALPWRSGQYELVVDSALEDCAGNNLARPFEVDVFDRVDATSAPELMRIPFAIGPN